MQKLMPLPTRLTIQAGVDRPSSADQHQRMIPLAAAQIAAVAATPAEAQAVRAAEAAAPPKIESDFNLWSLTFLCQSRLFSMPQYPGSLLYDIGWHL